MGRQGIVVTDPQLIDGDRIVLIDDRQGADPAQRAQGVAGIDKAPTIGEVVASQQQLSHREIKEPLPETHQLSLTDCCQGLLAGDVGRRHIAAAMQASATGSHGARRDQHHLALLAAGALNEPGNIQHVLSGQRLTARSDQITADFQHQAAPIWNAHAGLDD